MPFYFFVFTENPESTIKKKKKRSVSTSLIRAILVHIVRLKPVVDTSLHKQYGNVNKKKKEKVNRRKWLTNMLLNFLFSAM